jgi:3-isopropylmalate/(R)-2-methylmalate dehydratase large subunit
MAMTVTEKIIASKAQRQEVRPGEIVDVAYDWCMANDPTIHISAAIYQKEFGDRVSPFADKIVFVFDHNVPADSVKTAQAHKIARQFAAFHKVKLYEGQGICHQLMIERHVLPGQLILGADSHTPSYGALSAFAVGVGSTDFVGAIATGSLWLMVPASLRFDLAGEFSQSVTARDLILKIIGDIGADGATYKAMEFAGAAIQNLSVAERIVLCNMATEAGAKNGIIAFDQVVADYIREQRGKLPEDFQVIGADADAEYEAVCAYDLGELQPMAAAPHSVDNVGLLSDLFGLRVDQAFVGSCNAGRIEDLRIAAKMLRGRRIHQQVRLLIAPASQRTYLQALNEGLINIFLDCGAQVLNPNCSVCWGACQGVVGDGEVLISTGTRNFKGRSGSSQAEVYLASVPASVAAALAGEIVDPREFI